MSRNPLSTNPFASLRLKLLYGLSKPIRLLILLVVISASTLSTQLPQGAFAQGYQPRTLPPLVRGAEGDLWADVIIGKPDFSAISPYTTSGNKLFWPHGVIVDRSSTPNKLYVYDAGNNRILGLDLAKCLANPGDSNCAADLVIGQKDFTSSGCNGDSGFQGYPGRAPASASTLCGQPEHTLSVTETGSGASMAVDAQGSLYVADYWNHRVLKYNSPFTTDTVADEVWGQDDFSQNTCNKGRPSPDADTLCFSWGSSNNLAAGVEIDPGGNLWVTDSGNYRVLRFPAGSRTADLVLGQDNFTTNRPGTEANKFKGPSAVRVSPLTGRIYVADQGSSRVLMFNPPFGNGAAGSPFGAGFYGPTGLDFDPKGGVWINNSYHRTVERWDETTGTLMEVLGSRGNANILGATSGSIGIDSAGNKYVTVGAGELQHDLVMYAAGSPTVMPTRKIFGTARVGNRQDERGIASALGVAVADGQLIVADEGRLLFWNDPGSLFNGKPADGFAGGAANFGDFSKWGCCIALKADKSHHLWVSMRYNGSMQSRIEVFQLPLTAGASPIAWITYPLPVLGGGAVTNGGKLAVFWGLAPTDDGRFLWVSHSDGNRVFRIRDPLTNPVVDVILGQKDFEGMGCNRGGPMRAGATPDSLCAPGSLSLDRLGNLYVSDHSLEIQGNMRLLVFNKDLFPENTDKVIYAPAASRIFPDVATWEPAFDAQNRMVVGYNPYWPHNQGDGGRFPGVFNDPFSPSNEPNAFLNDYYSMAISATFDDAGNLYVGDLNRGRVLVYKNPFGGAVRASDRATVGSAYGACATV